MRARKCTARCSTYWEAVRAVTYSACLMIAESYCHIARVTAGRYYPAEQDLQERYETYIKDNVGIRPSAPPVLYANGKPEGATWTERPGADSCTTNWYICSSANIVLEK